MDINNVTTSEKNIYVLSKLEFWKSEKNFLTSGKNIFDWFFLLELHKYGLTRSTKNHHFLTELEFGIPSKI